MQQQRAGSSSNSGQQEPREEFVGASAISNTHTLDSGLQVRINTCTALKVCRSENLYRLLS